MAKPARCSCPTCRRTRKRVYGIVWNWRHNQREMIDRLCNLIETIRTEERVNAEELAKEEALG